jgi:hypothetical protein
VSDTILLNSPSWPEERANLKLVSVNEFMLHEKKRTMSNIYKRMKMPETQTCRTPNVKCVSPSSQLRSLFTISNGTEERQITPSVHPKMRYVLDRAAKIQKLQYKGDDAFGHKG